MLSNDFEYLPCSYLWTRLLVYWDGTTTIYCRDYEGKHLFLGNAKEIPLKEMWYSNKLFNLKICICLSGKEKN